MVLYVWRFLFGAALSNWASCSRPYTELHPSHDNTDADSLWRISWAGNTSEVECQAGVSPTNWADCKTRFNEVWPGKKSTTFEDIQDARFPAGCIYLKQSNTLYLNAAASGNTHDGDSRLLCDVDLRQPGFEFAELINQHRVDNNRKTLCVNAKLTLAAMRHSRDMARRGYSSWQALKPAPYGKRAQDWIQHVNYTRKPDEPAHKSIVAKAACGYWGALETESAAWVKNDESGLFLRTRYMNMGYARYGDCVTILLARPEAGAEPNNGCDDE